MTAQLLHDLPMRLSRWLPVSARLKLIVPMAVVGIVLPLGPAPVHACTLAAPYSAYELDETADDSVAPKLRSAEIDIMRVAEIGSSMCGDIGQYLVLVDAIDDTTEADDLGVQLTLLDGTLPFLPPPETVEPDQEGGGFTSWFDDHGSSFGGTVEVRVVDRAGNVSQPIRLTLGEDDGGLGEDDGGLGEGSGLERGCSISSRPSGGHAGWLALGFFVVALRRRRTRSVEL